MGGMPGQRVEVRIEPGRIVLDYYAALAAIRVLKEARTAGVESKEWAPRQAEALRSGLRVRVGDAELALTPRPVETAAALRGGAVVELHLSAEAALPADAGALAVRLDNFPDEPCYYAASIEVSGEYVVVGTNLARVEGGALRDNNHGAWRRSDDGRKVEFTLRSTRWWESRADGPLPERLEGLVGWDVARVGGVAGIAGIAAVATTWRLRRREMGI